MVVRVGEDSLSLFKEAIHDAGPPQQVIVSVLLEMRVPRGEKTQRALSTESGVSTSTIWLLETREKNERFHPPTLTKLARTLEVEPTELVSGE